jgi:uncharacterized membrane protein
MGHARTAATQNGSGTNRAVSNTNTKWALRLSNCHSGNGFILPEASTNFSMQPSSPSRPTSRLSYIDWMRGLACVLMFQTHCYDSWLGGSARKSTMFVWSQLLGSLPAPLFLFLAGISVVLVMDRAASKGAPSRQIAQKTMKRGAEILALGFLFRLQEFAIAWGWAPWTDLLRVDILNTIGVAIILMGFYCWLILPSVRRRSAIWGACGIALAISLLTPPLWTTLRPTWLPWPVESYINGVHNLGRPQASLFPIFPWAGFAFAGLAAGLLLNADWARNHEIKFFMFLGAVGAAIFGASRFLDAQRWQFYAAYDYWHTSPSFFLLRIGLLLMILTAVYAWCRWGLAQWGFSPLIQMGKTSLLVYWVHIEFVYGRVSILPKRAVDIRTASAGLAIICVAMVLLSIARTRLKGRGAEALGWWRRPANAT